MRREAEVVIEVPRGGFVKRRLDGGIDYVSPLPCPFNYGAVPGELGEDGDPLDAVVLGTRLPRGHRAVWPVRGVVRFIDRGHRDDKLICAKGPIRRRDLASLRAFFRSYGLAKGLVGGPTRFVGIELASG